MAGWRRRRRSTRRSSASRRLSRNTRSRRPEREGTTMAILTRRSVLRGSMGLAAAGALARPHVANTAATTAEVWWNQGFAPEEDVSFKALVADYQKASGNTIDFAIVP